MLKKHNKKQEAKQIERQKKVYKRNFYKFAKEREELDQTFREAMDYF